MVKIEKLMEDIKILRAGCGCVEKIHSATELAQYMGFDNLSDKHKSSRLIAVIETLFEDAKKVDSLLLALNLLKPYENIHSVNKRRLAYYNDYLSNDKLTNITDTLRKREDKLIEELANFIVLAKENGTLKAIIDAAPKELKLPAARMQKDISSKDNSALSPDKDENNGGATISGIDGGFQSLIEPLVKIFPESLQESMRPKDKNKKRDNSALSPDKDENNGGATISGIDGGFQSLIEPLVNKLPKSLQEYLRPKDKNKK